MDLPRQFHKSLENQWLTRFHTNTPDEDHFTGVVVLVQRSFLVLLADRELAWDGFEILPKRILTGYRDGEYEQRANAIHRFQGDIDRAVCPAWLSGCRTLGDVLLAMQAQDVWPGVEVAFEDDEGPDTAFYVGPILDVREDEFSIHCYDATGDWEAVYDLEYDDVIRLCFGDNYTTRFNAYMRAEGPARPAT